MKSTTCHICGYENQEENSTFCLRCGTDLTNKQETLVLEGTPPSARYATADKITALAMEGFIYLTDKRLIIIPAKMRGFGLTGALTATVYNKMTTSGIISVPFEQMKVIKDSKFGLLAKAILIETIDGELIKMSMRKRNDWKEAIINHKEQLSK